MMGRHLFSSPGMASVVERYRQWVQQHDERGCAPILMAGERRWVGACSCTCPDHGCAEATATDVYLCAYCRDDRLVRARMVYPEAADRNHPLFGRLVPCPECHGEDELQRADWLRRSSGIHPDWWIEYALDRLDPASMIGRVIREWIAGAFLPPFLTLAGGVGTGKTHGAIACAAAWLGTGGTVRFAEVPTMLDQLRASYREQAQEADMLRPYKAVGMLVLDDMGAEKGTDWADERLYMLVNDRYMRGATTVITTNVTTPPAGSRLWSRVLGNRSARVVLLNGKDQRQL